MILEYDRDNSLFAFEFDSSAMPDLHKHVRGRLKPEIQVAKTRIMFLMFV